GAWLRRFKYDVPPEVEALMGDYLEQGTRFLVVRVHLKKLLRGEIQRLRPLKIEYQSDELVLPVRMAAVGRDTPSEFLFFALASEGLMAVSSHTAVRMPSQQEVPHFVASELADVHAEALKKKASEHSEAVALLEFSG